ncbi:LCP family protein [Streptomyces sp. NPDC046977]|uniref:LCP family protein n=1 Tax=Streptomyces sp. NPDC046977 TaxID=3154703 RepID=UPI0033E065EE
MSAAGGKFTPGDERRRNRGRRGAAAARDLGWDDSLYEDDGDGGKNGEDGEGGRHAGTGASPARVPSPRDGGDSRRPAGRRPRSRGRRIAKGVAIGLSLLVLGTAGAGWGYYQHLNGNIRKGERSSGDSKVARSKTDSQGRAPLNILLLGSDSRSSEENIDLGGHREGKNDPPLADVQMLLHVSADRRSASVMSIPRDTRVDIPRCVDPDSGRVYEPVNTIINASLARGGPGCTLATWQNLTHIYIDHWMMVDFSGVVDLTTQIGGVDVCVEKPVWDRPTRRIPRGGSGLKLTTAGHHVIKGKQALQWLRTRDAFGSDLGRASAQHMYMNSMMRQMKSQNLFGNPGRLTGLAETATKALKVSAEIGSVDKLYGMAMELKDIPVDRITTTTMPRIPDPQNSNHLLPAPGDAERLFTMIRNDIALDSHGGKAGNTPKPQRSGPAATPAATIPVTVLNGTAGTDGVAVSQRATGIANALKAKGFAQARPGQQQQPSTATVVSYPAKDGQQGKADALAVAGALGIPAAAVKASSSVPGISLVVGADWKEGTDYAKTLPSAGSVPESADVQNGAQDACMPIYYPYYLMTPARP